MVGMANSSPRWLDTRKNTRKDPFKTQVGTLACASNLDMATATVTVEEVNGGIACMGLTRDNTLCGQVFDLFSQNKPLSPALAELSQFLLKMFAGLIKKA